MKSWKKYCYFHSHRVVIAFYLCLHMHVFVSVFSVTAMLACLHVLLLLYPIQSATSLSNQNSEQQACSITLSKHAWHSLSSWEYCYQWHGPEQEPYLIGKENIWSHSLASWLCNTWVDVYLLWIYFHAEMHNTTFKRFMRNAKVNLSRKLNLLRNSRNAWYYHVFGTCIKEVPWYSLKSLIYSFFIVHTNKFNEVQTQKTLGLIH